MRLWKRAQGEFRRGVAALRTDAVAPRNVSRLSGPLQRPVLLLHGFASTPKMMAPLERSLRRLGRKVIRVPISPGRDDLRESACHVQRVLDELSTGPGFNYADIVGHSMGGLVATYTLKRLDRGRSVRTVVTLGTPHRGGPAAALGVLAYGRISRAVWQMLPRSEFTRSLADLPVPSGTSLISISGGSDWVVPRSFSKPQPHEGAYSHTVDGCSHVNLLINRPVHDLVAAALRPEVPEAYSCAA